MHQRILGRFSVFIWHCVEAVRIPIPWFRARKCHYSVMINWYWYRSTWYSYSYQSLPVMLPDASFWTQFLVMSLPPVVSLNVVYPLFFLIFLYFVGIIEHYMQIIYTHTNVFLAKQAPATPCRVLFRWMALFLQEQEMRDPALLPSTITAHTNPGPEI